MNVHVIQHGLTWMPNMSASGAHKKLAEKIARLLCENWGLESEYYSTQGDMLEIAEEVAGYLGNAETLKQIVLPFVSGNLTQMRWALEKANKDKLIEKQLAIVLMYANVKLVGAL